MTKDQILNRAEAYIKRYYECNHNPTPYRLISMRFIKACNRLGIDLIDTLASDARFDVFMVEDTGATKVMLVEHLNAPISPSTTDTCNL